MATPLRALIVEDEPDDAHLLVHALKRANYDVSWARVETADGMRAELQSKSWDIILSDNSLPRFGASAALQVTRELEPDLPFIVVSGSIGEEAAVALMRAGANDYLFKGSLARLGVAVERELREAESRRERRRAVQALELQTEFLRRVIDTSPNLIFAKDRDGRFRLANHAVAVLYGTCPEDLVGRTDADFNPDITDIEGYLRDDRTVIETGVAREIEEERVTDAAGTVRWFQTVKAPLTTPAGERLVLGIANEITARKEAEEGRRALSDRLELVARASNDVVYDYDIGSGAVWWSEKLTETFGYGADEDVSTVEWFHAHVHPEDLPELTATFEGALASRAESWSGEYRFRRADGSYATVLDRGYLMYGPGGQPARLVGAMLDITDRRRLEEQFRQAQKMEAVGRLAGGIAHDFNNILTVITSLCDVVLEELDAESPVRPDILEVLQAGERAAQLTRQLLAFSRKQVLQPTVLDPNAVVSNFQEMVRRLVGEDIEFATALAADLGRVRADRGQIEQVLMNLVVNARDAMPAGGRLVIETANVELGPAYARKHAAATPGPHVMIAVSDTGTGMDAATQARLFEPFFTTKEQGKGTGLGLATVYGIVQQSGGHIRLDSKPGHGSTFKVYLPRVEDTATPAARQTAGTRTLRGTETILVVEDDAAVRMVTTRLLRGAGYDVLEAAHGVQALDTLGRREEPIHLLMTDVVMPYMSGADLARQARRLSDTMRVIFTSGYAGDTATRQGILGRSGAFLQKPFSPRELLGKVREVLDEPLRPMRHGHS